MILKIIRLRNSQIETLLRAIDFSKLGILSSVKNRNEVGAEIKKLNIIKKQLIRQRERQ